MATTKSKRSQSPKGVTKATSVANFSSNESPDSDVQVEQPDLFPMSALETAILFYLLSGRASLASLRK
jgi:hypothetical protein